MDDLADSGMDTTTTAGIESPMKSPVSYINPY